MAFCPKCGGPLGQRDAVCPACGYDFPEPKQPPSRMWLHLALIALVVVAVVFFRDNPVVAVIIGVSGLLFYLSLLLGLWRLMRDE
jgi:hypothetical protein